MMRFCSRCLWNQGEDGGSLPWNALDLEQASQAADALLHRVQAEMARKRAERIKPHPIVTHLQDDRFGRLAQSQVYVPGTGMLDRVMHRFLCNTIEFLFDRER